MIEEPKESGVAQEKYRHGPTQFRSFLECGVLVTIEGLPSCWKIAEIFSKFASHAYGMQSPLFQT
jgi:hypothetical protein